MKSANSFEELYRQLRLRKVPFLMVFFATVFLTYLVLYIIDFIPEPVTVEPEAITAEQVGEAIAPLEPTTNGTFEVLPPVAATPHTIIFDRLDKQVAVLNPESREIADLDAALLEGVVRHPDSADFREDGNMLILGHSSYLPNVLNRNFQAFNGIQDMTWGDKIRLVSDDTEYVYRVDKVYEAKASEVFVPETPGEARLTLATCDSFGGKDDRYIVEAVLIGKTAL